LGWAAQSVYESVCKEGEGEMATKDFRSVMLIPRYVLMLIQRSVVLEWLKRKQEQGVEKGWKDGGPQA
jgi:3-hydroxyisobutyrate dehydrogenase